GRLLRLLLAPLALVAVVVVVRSVKLGHLPLIQNAIVPIGASALGVWIGLLLRHHGWRATIVATALLAAGMAGGWWAVSPRPRDRGEAEAAGRSGAAAPFRRRALRRAAHDGVRRDEPAARRGESRRAPRARNRHRPRTAGALRRARSEGRAGPRRELAARRDH